MGKNARKKDGEINPVARVSDMIGGRVDLITNSLLAPAT